MLEIAYRVLINYGISVSVVKIKRESTHCDKLINMQLKQFENEMTMLAIEEEEIGGVAPLDRPPSISSASMESEESMNGDIPSALEAEELQLALNKVQFFSS